MTEQSAFLDTPLGPLVVTWEGGEVTGIELDPEQPAAGPASPPAAVGEQLETYFRNGAASFDLPLALRGTPFQLRVWTALRGIPAGRTVTYGELARALGTSARAVGAACRANPCPIVVPCHRVVAANGLGGFGGETSGRKLEVKRWLLRHEAVARPSVWGTASGPVARSRNRAGVQAAARRVRCSATLRSARAPEVRACTERRQFSAERLARRRRRRDA